MEIKMERTKNILLGIEDIAKLQQYLYLDEANTVVVENAIGVNIELRLDEEGTLWKKNLNFPDAPEMREGSMDIQNWLSVIDQLKEQPLKEMAGWNVDKRIQNRWDEIQAIVGVQLSLNRKPQ